MPSKVSISKNFLIQFEKSHTTVVLWSLTERSKSMRLNKEKFHGKTVRRFRGFLPQEFVQYKLYCFESGY